MPSTLACPSCCQSLAEVQEAKRPSTPGHRPCLGAGDCDRLQAETVSHLVPSFGLGAISKRQPENLTCAV